MYYLVLNGVQAGPYPVEKVRAMLASGEISPETLVWTEGQADWQPVNRVLAPAQPVPAVATTPVPPIRAGSSGLFSFLGGVGMTLAIVGALLLGLLVLAAGFIGYVAYIGTGLDRSSKAYVDEAIPAIVTGWSPDELVKRESKGFQKITNDKQLVRLFTEFRRLGALKSYDGCKGDSNLNFIAGTGRVITATYVGHATFENGEAQIKVILIQENGQWKIHGFRVDSPLFLK